MAQSWWSEKMDHRWSISHHQIVFERWYLNLFLGKDPRTSFWIGNLQFLDGYDYSHHFYPFAGAYYCFDNHVQYTKEDIQHAFDLMRFTIRESDMVETIGCAGMEKYTLHGRKMNVQGQGTTLPEHTTMGENSVFFLKLCVDEYRNNLLNTIKPTGYEIVTNKYIAEKKEEYENNNKKLEGCALCKKYLSKKILCVNQYCKNYSSILPFGITPILKYNIDKEVRGIHYESIKALLEAGFSPNERCLYPFWNDIDNCTDFFDITLLGLLFNFSWHHCAASKVECFINCKFQNEQSIHMDIGPVHDGKTTTTGTWEETNTLTHKVTNVCRKSQNAFLRRYIDENHTSRIPRPGRKRWGIQKFRKKYNGPENWFHAPSALIQILQATVAKNVKKNCSNENKIVACLFDNGLDPNCQMGETQKYPLWAGSTALFHAHEGSADLLVALLNHPEVDLELMDANGLRADQMMNRRSLHTTIRISDFPQTIWMFTRFIRMQRKVQRKMKNEIVQEYFKKKQTEGLLYRLARLPEELRREVLKYTLVPFVCINKRELFLQWEILNRM